MKVRFKIRFSLLILVTAYLSSIVAAVSNRYQAHPIRVTLLAFPLFLGACCVSVNDIMALKSTIRSFFSAAMALLLDSSLVARRDCAVSARKPKVTPASHESFAQAAGSPLPMSSSSPSSSWESAPDDGGVDEMMKACMLDNGGCVTNRFSYCRFSVVMLVALRAGHGSVDRPARLLPNPPRKPSKMDRDRRTR